MLDDATILDGAFRHLPNPNVQKRWMTARALAHRMRSKESGTFARLQQDQLFEVLVNHSQSVPLPQRLVRPSRLPSSKTLETLWGRVKEGERDDGESPILRESTKKLWNEAVTARQTTMEEEDGGEPNFFLTYSHIDETEALIIGGLLDERGYSTWVAGERIAPGQNINDMILKAMNVCSAYAYYLTEQSANSGWARKELLAPQGERKQYIIVDGSDHELIEILTAFSEGKSVTEFSTEWKKRLDRFRSLDSDFQNCLRNLAQIPGRVFTHLSIHEENRDETRGFPPVTEFPICETQRIDH